MARIILRIDITRDAKSNLDAAAERRGMKHLEITSRLVEWLDRQPPGVQAGILGQYPKVIEADVARLLLEQMDKPG